MYFISIQFLPDIQSKLISVVIFLVLMWSLEALPIGVTSLLPIILFPLLGILPINDVTSNYSKPIIFLFLGGFLIAIAVEKLNLHKYFVSKLMNVFPKTSFGIIFSVSLTSAILNIKKRLVLATAYGASIGGILTPNRNSSKSDINELFK